MLLIRSDLEFILQQIEIAEAHAAGEDLPTLVGDPTSPFGLRTVDGSFNNLTNPTLGAADQVFPRMTTPEFRDAADGTSFAQTQGDVTDPQPRLISNLVSDQTSANPAAVSAAGDVQAEESGTLPMPNVAPTEDGVPFNTLFTFFGQFFDHGLDLVTKGGSGNVFIPLQPDDPLFQPGAPTNFMVLSRATNQPGPDGELGTADDVHEHLNQTTSLVDQNQTYTSHPSHQAFLREYELDADGKPVATGRFLESSEGGLATWGDVKAQARELLGIDLSDENAADVPLLATDPYGNFIPGPNGFPQLVTEGPDGEEDSGDEVLVEGNPDAPISTADAVSSGHAFLDDLSQEGNPAGKIADTDDVPGLSNIDGSDTEDSFDDEVLNAHFATGDGRGNENIGLTAVHHVFHSEHNRMVGEMQELITATDDPEFIAKWKLEDGSWDGERLFQAARFTTEMRYQHLVFEEFARRVQPEIDEFESIDPNIDPSIVAEFAHTVYRFGHTILTDTVGRTSSDGTSSDVPLIEAFLNPMEFAASGATPEEAAGALVRGMSGQTGNEIDEFVTEAVRNNLLGLPLDLASINITRGRDTGIPPLNEVRSQFFDATGGDERLAPYDSWNDFGAALRNPESLVNFVAAYGTHPTIVEAETVEDKRAAAVAIVLGGAGAPEDRLEFLESDADSSGLDQVDFWIGGLAEAPTGEGLLGPTFNYVFETQLENLQNGDRFYYLHRTAGMNFFTQLEETSFAELIMSNTDATHLPFDVFGAGNAVLAGTVGSDNLTGTDADETLWGDGGDDMLEGGAGNDAVVGGVGNDTLTDAGGDDVMSGGDGDDRIDAVAGVDLVLGGAGDDDIVAGGGDEIFAGLGNDTVVVGDVSDEVLGNEGDDRLEGGAGDDVMFGDNHHPTGESTIEGNDVLIGAGGDDLLDGENGDDVAVFSEDVENYDITVDDDGSFTVAHVRGAQSDGTDTLVNIEQLEFAGETITASDFLLA
jgi:Ca2+-binding RTX toxin-like protein